MSAPRYHVRRWVGGGWVVIDQVAFHGDDLNAPWHSAPFAEKEEAEAHARRQNDDAYRDWRATLAAIDKKEPGQ